jgi:probable phosphoglycerate mutase
MTARHVFLVRHGRTALNAAGRIRGHLDPPLDEVGQSQALALSQQLAHVRPVRIVSSPLHRATQTALPLCRVSNLGLIEDSRLADRDYGPWAGEEIGSLVARFGSVDAAPEVEARSSVLIRARAVLDEQRFFLDDGACVLVAHEVVNRLLLASLDPSLGEPDDIPQRTGCWNLLTLDGRGWQVEQVDQVADSSQLME